MKYITTLPSTPTYIMGGFNFKLIQHPSLPANFIFDGIEKKIKYSDYKNNYHWIDVIYINQQPYRPMETFVLKQQVAQVAPYNPYQSNY